MKIQLIEQRVHSNTPKGRIFRLLAEKDGREIISPALFTHTDDKDMIVFLRKFNTLYENYSKDSCFHFDTLGDQVYQLNEELKAMKEQLKVYQGSEMAALIDNPE